MQTKQVLIPSWEPVLLLKELGFEDSCYSLNNRGAYSVVYNIVGTDLVLYSTRDKHKAGIFETFNLLKSPVLNMYGKYAFIVKRLKRLEHAAESYEMLDVLEDFAFSILDNFSNICEDTLEEITKFFLDFIDDGYFQYYDVLEKVLLVLKAIIVSGCEITSEDVHMGNVLQDEEGILYPIDVFIAYPKEESYV